MLRLIACLCLLVASGAYPGMQDGTFCTDSSQLIFDDTVVRLEPTYNGEPIGYLTPGAVLDVREYTDMACSLNGYVSEWFEVEWYDGEWCSGFIPGYCIALAGRYVNDRDISEGLLLVGVTGIDSVSGEFACMGKLIRDEQTASVMFLSGMVARPGGTFPSYYASISPMDPEGLNGVLKILKFSISFNDEGYESYDIMILWTGSELVCLPAIHSVSFQGQPSDATRVILPSDEGGVEGSVIYRRNIVEYDDSGGETVLFEDEWTVTWNGVSTE